jgi:hypothetical protein
MFKQATTTPLSNFLMQTPHHKKPCQEEQGRSSGKKELEQRKSPRLKVKNSEVKTTIRLAQDLIAKKCGVISSKESLDSMTLQQYLNMYNKPLSDGAMEAITKFTEVVEAKKMKKKQKKGKGKKNGDPEVGKKKANKEMLKKKGPKSKKEKGKKEMTKSQKKAPKGAIA